LQFGIDEIARIALGGGAGDGGLGEKDRARIAQAIEASRRLQALEFALIMPWGRDRELSEVCNLLRVSPLPVRLYPDQKIRSVLRQQKERGFHRHFSVMIQRAPLSRTERALKRVMDIAIAVTALVVFAPLLLAISLVIKLDSPGPVIFRQRRCGFDDREFVILKFRTMTVLEDDGPIVQAKRDDERVTRVGRMLRRTSIDELPQLINVVRGEMSLVGPRPHAIAHGDEFKKRISNYALRHHVKPGVTGAAQVMGLRGETSRLSQMERRVERDLWYIDNWSWTLDLKIMAMTGVALLRFDAY
jgi:undecaprenyl-phosphate galactose phosphotransferase/putative colanic acid biosynthesis UDP-glucose lipid carrier transferase